MYLNTLSTSFLGPLRVTTLLFFPGSGKVICTWLNLSLISRIFSPLAPIIVLWNRCSIMMSLLRSFSYKYNSKFWIQVLLGAAISYFYSNDKWPEWQWMNSGLAYIKIQYVCYSFISLLKIILYCIFLVLFTYISWISKYTVLQHTTWQTTYHFLYHFHEFSLSLSHTSRVSLNTDNIAAFSIGGDADGHTSLILDASY